MQVAHLNERRIHVRRLVGRAEGGYNRQATAFNIDLAIKRFFETRKHCNTADNGQVFRSLDSVHGHAANDA